MEFKKHEKNAESFEKYQRNANKGMTKVKDQTMKGILNTLVDIPQRVSIAGPIGVTSVKSLAKDEVAKNKEPHLR